MMHHCYGRRWYSSTRWSGSSCCTRHLSSAVPSEFHLTVHSVTCGRFSTHSAAFNISAPPYAAQHNTAQRSAAQHSAAQHNTTQNSTTPNSTARTIRGDCHMARLPLYITIAPATEASTFGKNALATQCRSHNIEHQRASQTDDRNVC